THGSSYWTVTSDLPPSTSGRTLGRHSGSTPDRRTKSTVRDQHRVAAEWSKRGAICKRRCRLLRSNRKAKAPGAKNTSELGLGSSLARTQLHFDRSRCKSRTSNVSLGNGCCFQKSCIRTCVE